MKFTFVCVHLISKNAFLAKIVPNKIPSVLSSTLLSTNRWVSVVWIIQTHFKNNWCENKKVCIFGGGDSALDWAIELSKFADVTLVHRRHEFRGAEHIAQTARRLEKEGKLKIKTPFQIVSIEGEDKIIHVVLIRTKP